MTINYEIYSRYIALCAQFPYIDLTYNEYRCVTFPSR